VNGPAIVELPTTTVVVYPDWILEISERGDFVMTRDPVVDRGAEEVQ
jgi:N-methylhydantoinase A/oxoprolinase/acetone carboxylase beta subunit